jgi:uncharacterized membrane protein
MTRLRIAGLSTLLADGAATILAWSRMPERVPVHWNIRGDVDRIGSRLELLLLGPILLLFLWGVFEVLGVIDPRRSAPAGGARRRHRARACLHPRSRGGQLLLVAGRLDRCCGP